MHKLNTEQRFANDMAIAGHSFFLTGDAGTGKSYITKTIIENLRENGAKVIVCSSTGISCMPLIDVGAQTVHKMFGLKDGRYEPEQIEHLFADLSDSYYAERRARIGDADTLVIDKISMISKRTLNLVDIACRSCCDEHKHKQLGGLVIQFPSVNIMDPGKHSFKHPCFRAMAPHTIRLLEVIK
jgi:ATP-dependent exoDNAse (exonuclease V) alpha subunit